MFVKTKADKENHRIVTKDTVGKIMVLETLFKCVQNKTNNQLNDIVVVLNQ